MIRHSLDITIPTVSSKRRRRSAGRKNRVSHEIAAVKISGMQILSKAVKDMAYLQAADGMDYSSAMENYEDLIKDCSYNLAVCNETSWMVI